MDQNPRGWHSRGYLPHFDGGTTTQTVTFRLADSFPISLSQAWHDEIASLSPTEQNAIRLQRIEDYLDAGHGEAWLRDPRVAEMVEKALLFFDSERYLMHAWVIMPNHVHALFSPLLGQSLTRIVHSWKRFIAGEANKILGRTGRFWYQDYFDRYIRDAQHFENARQYIEMNPVKAGLCVTPEEWPWSSARRK